MQLQALLISRSSRLTLPLRRHRPELICPGAPAAELELGNISQVESFPGELLGHHSKYSPTHLQLQNKNPII